MKKELLQFIRNPNFPCIMAKAAAKTGNVVVHETKNILNQNEIKSIISKLYQFVNNYRNNSDKLNSFILCLSDRDVSFEQYEEIFWNFLRKLRTLDQEFYSYDNRVSSDPLSPNYSFSIMEEAFFIIALHPQSPRLARRFHRPAIVFNPHQQFEYLKKMGKFNIVRNVIRKRDKALQGYSNPMLQDFGTESEIFQYFGKVYQNAREIPFLKEFA